MTAKQLKTLRFIQLHTRVEGIPPSYDEIAHELGLKSKSGVVNLINALLNQRYITKHSSSARSLNVTRKGAAYLNRISGSCPTCGQTINHEAAA